jgi:hypothetical protein
MDGAIALLTLALVVITGYYAWQNRNMVNEMRLAREASSHPHLKLCFEPLGPMNVMLGLVNLGPGAAVGVDVTIEFHPRPGRGFTGELRRWRGELLPSGGQRDFFVPDSNGSMMSIERLAECVDTISLRGTMSDARGHQHVVDCTIGDLHEWDELLRNARERYKEAPLDKLAKETEKLAKAVGSAISKWSASGGGIHVRTDADIKTEHRAILKEREERLGEARKRPARSTETAAETDEGAAESVGTPAVDH